MASTCLQTQSSSIGPQMCPSLKPAPQAIAPGPSNRALKPNDLVVCFQSAVCEVPHWVLACQKMFFDCYCPMGPKNTHTHTHPFATISRQSRSIPWAADAKTRAASTCEFRFEDTGGLECSRGRAQKQHPLTSLERITAPQICASLESYPSSYSYDDKLQGFFFQRKTEQGLLSLAFSPLVTVLQDLQV